MISRSRLRLLADYFAATRNEVVVDEMFLALSKMNAAEVGHFPRVPHWIRLATNWPKLMRTASRIARVVWLAGGATIFFVREYLKFSHLHRSNDSVNVPQYDGAVLGLSTRVGDIVKPTQFPEFPRTWLSLPWVPLHEFPEGVKELPMLSLLHRQDLLGALADAVIVTQRMRRNRRLSPWVLQTYTAYRWFLVRRALNRLSGTLVTAEHYDRWAVLVDRSVRERRRGSNCCDRLVLVQHGAMGALNHESHIQKSLLHLPTRLRQVDELHVYNINEAAVFQSDVFATCRVARAIDIHFFKPAIELAGDTISDQPRLLFVGHPLCESFHVEVFRKLQAYESFEAYYKPHPKAPMSTSMAGVGWIIVNDESYFPRVDLLVSYPSTLVIEYGGVGVPASVHPLDMSLDDLPLFFEKTQEIIKINKKKL